MVPVGDLPGIQARYGRSVTSVMSWSRRFPVLDAALAGLLLVLAEITAATGRPNSMPVAAAALLGAVGTIPLIWRRRAPLGVLALTGAAALAELSVANSPGVLGIATLISLYTVVTSGPRRVSIGAGVISLVGVVIGAAISGSKNFRGVDLLFPAVVIAACWLIGDNVRVRRAYVAELEAKAAHAEEDRAAEVTRAASEERARIARELHDVVAHHVSVIAVQAGAGRLLAESGPPGDGPSWAAVESTARQALSELRQLLGVLRHDGEPVSLAPQAGLDQLDRLIADVRIAGLPVESRVEGSPVSLPAAVDLSAYRIIQEALTNVVKHQGSPPTVVSVAYQPDVLRLEVSSGPGNGQRPAPVEGSGQGIVGMRERAFMLGGDLDARPRADGGYLVKARIPLPGPGT